MAHTLEYPVELGIAYLFLAGYLLRTLFVQVQLPASVGVILSGFAFSYFCQEDILLGRDSLQSLAFFLVLLTAGLEIRAKDVRPYIFLMATLPATCELLAIAAYAVLVRGFTCSEGLVLGCVLVCIGDGLVIPKMKEFQERFRGHPMPRLVFTWAPLEASYGLALFGVMAGLARPKGQPEVGVALLLLANAVRVGATLVLGGLLGTASGWLISRRTRVELGGRQAFTGAPVESFLMILAVALVAFGLGASAAGGEAVVPMGFCTGSLFQPELLVIVTGTCFASVVDRQVLQDVEGVMGGVWVFGQLVLFSMLGSRTSFAIFPQLPTVLPIMAVGLSCRLLGVLLATFLTLRTTKREECPFSESTALADALFCFLATLPRATIQGALGAVPVTMRFFQNAGNRSDAQETICLAARLYIVVMSVSGMILLNVLGRRLLEHTAAQRLAEGGYEPCGNAMKQVAELFSLSTEQVEAVLRKAAELDPSSEDDCSPRSRPTLLRSLSDSFLHTKELLPPGECKEEGKRRVKKLKTGLVFAQFDLPAQLAPCSPKKRIRMLRQEQQP